MKLDKQSLTTFLLNYKNWNQKFLTVKLWDEFALDFDFSLNNTEFYDW